jgi:hypothetical protein
LLKIVENRVFSLDYRSKELKASASFVLLELFYAQSVNASDDIDFAIIDRDQPKQFLYVDLLSKAHPWLIVEAISAG